MTQERSNINTQQAIITLVDDDMALADSMRLLLKTSGHQCNVHGDANSLLRALEANPQQLQAPGCLICDVRMPGLSGRDLFFQLRSQYPRMCWPIIFITGHAELQIAVDTLTQGAFDFIQKPFDPQRLLDTVSRALERSRQLSSNLEFLLNYETCYSALTRQERSVMDLILKNLTNKEISETLQNSVRTIELHRASVYRKMLVDSGITLSKIGERYHLLSTSTGLASVSI